MQMRQSNITILLKYKIGLLVKNSQGVNNNNNNNETINHIISECSKLAHKEYKTRHDWVGKVIHPNNSIIENGQNTEKSPGDLRRLAVTQSSVKDHHLTLLWKTLMSNNKEILREKLNLFL